ncbi:UDP-2,4-diacetamido-2,4,6-trideoxy-beta-L-altropyranose hydrolase [Alkalihalobacillus trypoxylicola]|uniref:Glycosyl transferase family 28 C-terminal domain-containing protein n=1 Tax=Alkalihalobacillus trypoxylicola TaxID=519424 RepID=A0A162ETV2_9BACI|nr:UDP-2,4-diacetamido-2,4,6-trideoxy-beta-L-altropyranose hydrolase [Alkalihalobacillus trypoxylicola]KYG33713.1 hypothetical protein AZF04_15930 [Alkalihalobacillus trypoxylicola]
MNIAFRVDASVHIGTGHVMRCITLAESLKSHASKIVFICKNLPGHLMEHIEKKEFLTISLTSEPFKQEKDAEEVIEKVENINLDFIIIDHYEIDQKWENLLRAFTKKIIVIDDLANRHHDCDILLDQNFYPSMKQKYKQLVPSDCQLLLGPKYLLLRREFYNVLHRKRGEFKNLLVFFGGSDPTNETSKALLALAELKLKNVSINVVVGNANPNKDDIKGICEKIGANYYCQIPYMAKLMEEADLSLGAGGSTMWERSFVGLPSLVTMVAENQCASTEAAAEFGAIKLTGWHETVTKSTYMKKLNELIHNENAFKSMQLKGYELIMRNENKKFEQHPLINLMFNERC